MLVDDEDAPGRPPTPEERRRRRHRRPVGAFPPPPRRGAALHSGSIKVAPEFAQEGSKIVVEIGLRNEMSECSGC
eukprot:7944175-Pyramimonas_sp.AAC.1